MAQPILPVTAQTEINGLYVTLYNVEATQAGFQYWLGQLKTFDPTVTGAGSVINPNGASADANFLGMQMTSQAPQVGSPPQSYFQQIYPASMNDVQYVEALYNNAAGFNGTAAGIQFWVSQLQSLETGGDTVTQAREAIAGSFVQGFLENNLSLGAQFWGLDQASYNALVAGQQTLINRVNVSEYWAVNSTLGGGALNYTAADLNGTVPLGPSNPFSAAMYLNSIITSNPSSVTAADNAINQAIALANAGGHTEQQILAPIFALQIAPTTQTVSLTVQQDLVVSGQPFPAGGSIVPQSGVVVLAPLGGIFGGQETLTAGDTVQLTGNNNALQATVSGGGINPFTINGLTIQGVQNWTFQNIGGPTTLLGPNLGGPGTTGAATSPGVQTITVQNSSGAMNIGATGAGQGVNSIIQTLNVNNNNAGWTRVVEKGSLFSGTDTLAVNVNNVTGFGPGGAYGVNVGPDTGTTGYQNFNLAVQDSVGDSIMLGALGATNAKTITASDATGATGALTLWANTFAGSGDGNWAHVTTINGSGMTGKLTVTGAEQGGGNNGLLEVNHSLASISGGAGGAFFDLTSLTASDLSFNGTTVTGGGGTTEADFAAGTLHGLFGPVSLTNVQIIGDAGETGGTINDANLTDSVNQTIRLLTAAGANNPTLAGAFTITHGANNLTVDFGATNFAGNAITINDASLTSTTDVLNLLFNGAGASGAGPDAVNGYATVNMTVQSVFGGDFGAGGSYTQTGNPGGGTELLNIAGSGPFSLGNTFSIITAIGTPTVTILGGPLDVTPGHIVISGDNVTLGITNATLIDASTDTFGNLTMTDPDSSFTLGVTVKGTNHGGGTNLLQGSLSAVTQPAGLTTSWLGTGGADTIFGGNSSGDQIFTTGGATTVNLNALNGLLSSSFADTVHYSQFGNNIASNPIDLAVTNNADLVQHENLLTITNFAAGPVSGGPGGDVINLGIGSWGIGALGNADAGKGLVGWDGHTAIGIGDAVMQLITSAAVTVNPDTVLLDGIATAANAAGIVANMTVGTGSFFLNGTGIATNTDVHMLVAYAVTGGGVNIADIDVDNHTGAALTNTAQFTTAGVTVTEHDIVHLAGVTLNSMDPHNVHFLA